MIQNYNNSFQILSKKIVESKNNRTLQDYLCSMVLPIWSFYECDLKYTKFKSVDEALPHFMPYFDADEIKYYLLRLDEFKNDTKNLVACCYYKIEYKKI